MGRRDTICAVYFLGFNVEPKEHAGNTKKALGESLFL